VFYCGALLTPCLISFLVLLAMVLLARWRELRGLRWCFWAGVCFGLAALGRGSNALFALLSVGFFRIETGGWRRAARPWLLVLVGAALVIGGMGLRNGSVGGKAVPVSANVAAFYIGHNPEATGLYAMPSFTSGAGFKDEVWGTRDALARKLGHPLTLAQASSWMVHEGMAYALSHPLDEARLAALKFYYFWNRTESATNLSYYFARDFSGWLRRLPLDFGWIAPLGLVGIVLQRRRWREHALLHMGWVTGLMTALLFFVSAEYRVIALPALFVFGASVPVVLWGWLRFWFRRSGDVAAGHALQGTIERNVAGALVCLVAFGVFCNVRDDRLRFQSLRRVDYLNFGVLYKDRGDLTKAETMLRRSLAIDPSYGPAYAAMADLKHKQGKDIEAARYAAEASRYQPAEALADSASVNRAAAQALIAHGGELYQSRQYVLALRVFHTIKSIADQSGDADMGRSALNNIGLCQFQLGKLDSAEAVFGAIMTADPTYVKAINNMAKVRLAQGRKADAAALFRRVLEIDPGNRIARKELADLGQ
jgi:Tfp pilus assembly protein PilF